MRIHYATAGKTARVALAYPFTPKALLGRKAKREKAKRHLPTYPSDTLLYFPLFIFIAEYHRSHSCYTLPYQLYPSMIFRKGCKILGHFFGNISKK